MDTGIRQPEAIDYSKPVSGRTDIVVCPQGHPWRHSPILDNRCPECGMLGSIVAVEISMHELENGKIRVLSRTLKSYAFPPRVWVPNP